MNSDVHLGDRLRDDLMRVFCFVGLLFAVYFFYVDWTYNRYVEDYRNTQRQEVQTANQKITASLTKLRDLTEALRTEILAAPEDSLSIQTTLKAGQWLSERYAIPTIQSLSYYKFSRPQAVITPALIAPLDKVPQAFRKPVKELTALTTQKNAMVGMLPVLDKNNRLKGIVEVKVPSLDIQKIIGADDFKTLEFPQLFGINGIKLIQNKPLEFTPKSPLSYLAYLTSFASYFWLLAFAVLIGAPLVFFSGRLAKKRVGFVYGYQLGHLSNQLKCLKTRSSFQHSRIQRYEEISGVLSKAVNFLRGSPAHPSKKQTLINAAAELAEDLSSGMSSNLKRESLNLKTILEEVVLYFTDQIQKQTIDVKITCPEELTFIGDSLFVRMILLNVMGSPLFYMPKKGRMSISAIKKEGLIHIEIKDNRYSLSELGKKYVKTPFDFYVDDHKLQQICLQNRIGYTLSQSEKGDFTTKVSFPLDSDLKIIPFPYQKSPSIH